LAFSLSRTASASRNNSDERPLTPPIASTSSWVSCLRPLMATVVMRNPAELAIALRVSLSAAVNASRWPPLTTPKQVLPSKITTVAAAGNEVDHGSVVRLSVFDPPGRPPVFGLWQDGQGGPPTDTQVIAHGTTGGHAWKVTAYEGPWGTCFVTDPYGTDCVPAMLDTTTILASAGGWTLGSAAPGVASLRVTLSNGKTVTARPVGVGNEDLFAFPAGQGVSPARWTAYNASGHQVGAGAVRPASA